MFAAAHCKSVAYRQIHTGSRLTRIAVWGLTLLVSPAIEAAVLGCASADVDCLITSIYIANNSPGPDEIQLAAGAYTVMSPDNDTTHGPNAFPAITSNIAIRGAGKHRTIIERGGGAPYFRLFDVQVIDAARRGALSLAGLTVRNGRLLHGNGAGIYVDRGSLYVRDSVLEGHVNGPVTGEDPQQAAYGGAIASFAGSVQLTRTYVRDNAAYHGGGGVVMFGGRLVVRNSAFIENHAVGESSIGGAMVTFDSSESQSATSISDSVFKGNEAGGGGAISAGVGITRIVRTTLRANRATQGGAIQNVGTLVIKNSAVIANHAREGAGLWTGGNGPMHVINVTIARNVAEGPGFNLMLATGGGITVFGSPATIKNSTIADNHAEQGGGIANAGGSIGTALKLQNTIVARNSAVYAGLGTNCFAFSSDFPLISLGNNLIEDLEECALTPQHGDISADGGLGRLRRSQRPGWDHFPLRRGSRAIDAGNGRACPAFDQIGHARIDRCDIGSIEYDDDHASRP